MKRTLQTLLLALTLLLAVLTGCHSDQTPAEPAGTQTQAQTGAADPAEAPAPAAADPEPQAAPTPQFPEPVQASVILSDSGAALDGCDAAVDSGVVTLTQAGSYTLSGRWAAGQIVIAAPDKADVTLTLDGLELTNPTGPAIYALGADTVTLVLAEGTKNTLVSGEPGQTPDTATAAAEDDSAPAQEQETVPQAAIWAKNDLTITGPGSLTVEGNLNNGIQTKDDLAIEGGVLDVTAVDNALKGNDAVFVQDGTLTLTAGGDGIKADSTDPEKGNVTVLGGDIYIDCAGDALQAANTLDIRGGVFTLTTGGGAENAPAHTSGSGGWEDDSVSAKGLKAGVAVYLSAGDFFIDASDDGIHANGEVQITGGGYTILSGDDGIHADAVLTIHAGTIDVGASYEGLEAPTLTVNGGTISIVSSDDGMNAGGGMMFGPGMGGGNTTAAADTALRVIRITGGSVYIHAGGDGIDSNGSVFLEGGDVRVENPNNATNGAIDLGTESGGEMLVSGGTLVATGNSGMAEGPGEGSTQGSILYVLPASAEPGTTVTLTDAAGNVLLSFTPDQGYNCVNLSCPELTIGQSYTITAGNQTVAVTLDSNVFTNRARGMGGGPGGGGPGGGGPGGPPPGR